MKQPPSRLSDVELARALLVCGRNVGAPPRAAMQRTLSRIEVAASTGLLATSVSLEVAAATTKSAATLAGSAANSAGTVPVAMSGAATTTTSLVVKLFVSALAVGLAGGGMAAVVTGRQAPRLAPPMPALVAQQTSRPMPRPSAIAQPFEGLAARGGKEAPALVQTAATGHALGGDSSQRPAAISSPNGSRKPAVVQQQQRNEATMSPELARELLLLDQARAAVERGDGKGALQWLSRYRQEFPNGQLAPEAADLRARAETQIAPNND